MKIPNRRLQLIDTEFIFIFIKFNYKHTHIHVHINMHILYMYVFGIFLYISVLFCVRNLVLLLRQFNCFVLKIHKVNVDYRRLGSPVSHFYPPPPFPVLLPHDPCNPSPSLSLSLTRSLNICCLAFSAIFMRFCEFCL